MAQTQISDVVVPAEFTAYQVENSLVSTALFQSGVAVPNGEMTSQLQAGAQQFTVPFWADAGETEADITSDNPALLSTPLKIGASKQNVRKSYLHQSWSEMSLASELSGSDALARVQSRVQAYWDRQFERRLVASLLGVLYSNVANNASDMVNDISSLTGSLANFNGNSVIDTALTLGDRLNDVKMIAMHSSIYGEALKNNEITFFKPSDKSLDIPTYKGMGVIVDDNLTTTTSGLYVTILMGPGALGFAVAEPRTGFGTEIFRVPSAGNGGGQTTLHSRMNLAMHPLGMNFTNTTVVGDSPIMAELALPASWTRAMSAGTKIGHRAPVEQSACNRGFSWGAAMQTVALYLRVSTLDQHPETQLHDLRAMAHQRGFEIVAEYTDRISGTKAKRPGLDELLRDARRGRFQVVLVCASDRIARSVRHFLEVLDELNHLTIEYVSFQENLDTGGPLGRAVVIIIGAIAELERNLIVERVRAGMRRARLEGRHISRRPVDVDRVAVLRERDRGQSLSQIATTHRVSRATVSRIIKLAQPTIAASISV